MILPTRRDQRSSIPRHAHAPAPSPSRRWSIRCIAFALVTDGNLGTPLAPRFRLRFGCAPLHSGLLSAIRCAPFRSRSPTLRPERPGTNFTDGSGAGVQRSHPGGEHHLPRDPMLLPQRIRKADLRRLGKPAAERQATGAGEPRRMEQRRQQRWPARAQTGTICASSPTRKARELK